MNIKQADIENYANLSLLVSVMCLLIEKIDHHRRKLYEVVNERGKDY